jgi:hypothetical protein
MARRKAVVAEILNKGGEEADARLKTYGAPSSFDALAIGGPTWRQSSRQRRVA